jgi:hypothetical protein
MALRPVEQVLLETLADIDPKEGERLTTEVCELSRARASRLGSRMLQRLMGVVLLLFLSKVFHEYFHSTTPQEYANIAIILVAGLLFLDFLVEYFLENVENFLPASGKTGAAATKQTLPL